MPALGMAQETGKLIRWLKSEGSTVTQGEPLMEVETDKATVEIEAPASGTLAAVTASEGEDIAVGQAIAVILAPGEKEAPRPATAPPLPAREKAGAPPLPAREKAGAPPLPANEKAGAPPLPARERAGERAAAPPLPAKETAGAPPLPARERAGAPPLPARERAGERVGSPGPRPAASPKARRLAAERGLDITRLQGSGPGGAVLEDDLLQAGGPQAEPALWRAMAENVSRSWREAPHFFVIREVDATAMVERRRRESRDVTISDLLVRSVAEALSRHPRMNASRPEVNVGLAVALPDGLIVPVIHRADRLDAGEIAARRKELLERVRSGKVRPSDVTGGTFTISNLGMYGVDVFTAILTEGQAGILAVGRIADRVVARDGAPVVRPMMTMSLSVDHRQADGVRAAEFMQTLVELLESPA